MKDSNETYGFNHRSESSKQFSKSLAYGVILLFVHLLKIRPKEIETVGLKISIADSSILYGTISLLFLYHLLKSANSSEIASAMVSIEISKHRVRAALKAARKTEKGKNIKQIKKSAKYFLIFTNIILSPYWIGIVSITIMGIIISGYDLYQMGDYIYLNSNIATFFEK